MNYKTEEIIPTCSNCGTELNKIEGKYGPFWGCKNFKECKFKGFSANKPRPKDKPEVRTTPTRDQILLEEIQAISKRLDAFEAGFAEKMGNLKKILVIISDKLEK